MADMKNSKVYKLVLTSMFTALITVCSWISIPTTVPFTLQTFSVFMTAGLLGLEYGTVSVILYILLGTVGLPVFSNFGAGVGVLAGPTGGYIIGFIFTAVTIGVITKLFGKKIYVLAVAMSLGMALCYVFGTVWFMILYGCDFVAALMMCVVPYLVFDALKIAAASVLVNRLSKFV